MGDASERFEKNAPGPFYTTGGCTACGAPEFEAPDLLAALTAENWDTYFVRQPATPEEVERACRAVSVCCLDTLRDGGRDPAIVRRLGNRPEYCDHPLPGGPIRMPGENDYSWARTATAMTPTAQRLSKSVQPNVALKLTSNREATVLSKAPVARSRRTALTRSQLNLGR